jgi:hypothetical protein
VYLDWLLYWFRYGFFICLHRKDDPAIGLSVRLCIKAVFEGEAPAFGIILSSIKEDEWETKLQEYVMNDWKEFAKQAVFLAKRMKEKNCIHRNHNVVPMRFCRKM